MLHVVCGFISSIELFYVLFFGFHNPYINVVCGFISSIELFYVLFFGFHNPYINRCILLQCYSVLFYSYQFVF